jgi:pimeloyl-ACP methyl ester carboxylesterase
VSARHLHRDGVAVGFAISGRADPPAPDVLLLPGWQLVDVPPGCGAALAERLGAANLPLLGIGHSPQLTVPAALADAVVDTWRGHPA